MLAPIAKALGASLPPSVSVYLALQGEMGATVFRSVQQRTIHFAVLLKCCPIRILSLLSVTIRYPKDYRSLLTSMKGLIQASRSLQQTSDPSVVASSGPAPVRTGLTFNFVVIDGGHCPVCPRTECSCTRLPGLPTFSPSR